MKRIILFIKKFFAWILSFFFDRNKTSKNSKKSKNKMLSKKSIKLNAKQSFVNRDEDMGESHIIDIYPYTEAKDLKSIDELIEKLEEAVEIINDEQKEKEIKVLKEIKETVKKTQDKEETKLNVAQEEEIKEVLEDAINDKEIHIDTEEKIINIQKEINKVIDNKINKHDKEIIEKAYYKYEKVNYVVATTMEIEELENDIKELEESVKLNNRKKSYYVDKVKEIEKKIKRLKKINKNPKVYDELERLKDDFYTKSIDKYDLLYSKEVFINLDKQCDNIIDYIETKEKAEEKEEETLKKEKEEEKKQRDKEQEEIRKLREQEKEKARKAREEYQENVIKRYLDLKKSNTILLNNILIHHERVIEDDIIKTLRNDYDDFLEGEENEFNFERNRQKTEVCKLYNNLLEVLSREQKAPYEPVEHINFPYQTLLEETIATKSAVENIAHKKTGVDIMLEDKSIMVSDKLNNELEKEKTKNREMGIKDKILVRKMQNE